MTELIEIIEKTRDKSQLVSGLGFFSKPILLTSGLHKGKIAKVYKGLKSRKLTDIMIKHHLIYVDKLKQLGVILPETNMYNVEYKNRYVLLILQEAYQKEELIRDKMKSSNLEDYILLTNKILEAAIEFIEAKERLQEPVIGFHPTTRNYAVKNNELHYFDTFPPMYMSQYQLNGFILRFAPFDVPIFRRLLQKRINMVSDEYYQDDKMITGIVGSACRLKPNDANKILDASKKFLEERIKDSTLKKHVLDILEIPPKLNKTWVTVRNLLGKEGQPNIK